MRTTNRLIKLCSSLARAELSRPNGHACFLSRKEMRNVCLHRRLLDTPAAHGMLRRMGAGGDALRMYTRNLTALNDTLRSFSQNTGDEIKKIEPKLKDATSAAKMNPNELPNATTASGAPENASVPQEPTKQTEEEMTAKRIELTSLLDEVNKARGTTLDARRIAELCTDWTNARFFQGFLNDFTLNEKFNPTPLANPAPKRISDACVEQILKILQAAFRAAQSVGTNASLKVERTIEEQSTALRNRLALLSISQADEILKLGVKGRSAAEYWKELADMVFCYVGVTDSVTTLPDKIKICDSDLASVRAEIGTLNAELLKKHQKDSDPKCPNQLPAANANAHPTKDEMLVLATKEKKLNMELDDLEGQLATATALEGTTLDTKRIANLCDGNASSCEQFRESFILNTDKFNPKALRLISTASEFKNEFCLPLSKFNNLNGVIIRNDIARAISDRQVHDNFIYVKPGGAEEALIDALNERIFAAKSDGKETSANLDNDQAPKDEDLSSVNPVKSDEGDTVAAVVLGASGSGKTVLMLHIAAGWKGDCHSNPGWVCFYTTMSGLVRSDYPKLTKGEKPEDFRQRREAVLCSHLLDSLKVAINDKNVKWDTFVKALQTVTDELVLTVCVDEAGGKPGFVSALTQLTDKRFRAYLQEVLKIKIPLNVRFRFIVGGTGVSTAGAPPGSMPNTYTTVIVQPDTGHALLLALLKKLGVMTALKKHVREKLKIDDAKKEEDTAWDWVRENSFIATALQNRRLALLFAHALKDVEECIPFKKNLHSLLVQCLMHAAAKFKNMNGLKHLTKKELLAYLGLALRPYHFPVEEEHGVIQDCLDRITTNYGLLVDEGYWYSKRKGSANDDSKNTHLQYMDLATHRPYPSKKYAPTDNMEFGVPNKGRYDMPSSMIAILLLLVWSDDMPLLATSTTTGRDLEHATQLLLSQYILPCWNVQELLHLLSNPKPTFERVPGIPAIAYIEQTVGNVTYQQRTCDLRESTIKVWEAPPNNTETDDTTGDDNQQKNKKKAPPPLTQRTPPTEKPAINVPAMSGTQDTTDDTTSQDTTGDDTQTSVLPTESHSHVVLSREKSPFADVSAIFLDLVVLVQCKDLGEGKKLGAQEARHELYKMGVRTLEAIAAYVVSSKGTNENKKDGERNPIAALKQKYKGSDEKYDKLVAFFNAVVYHDNGKIGYMQSQAAAYKSCERTPAAVAWRLAMAADTTTACGLLATYLGAKRKSVKRVQLFQELHDAFMKQKEKGEEPFAVPKGVFHDEKPESQKWWAEWMERAYKPVTEPSDALDEKNVQLPESVTEESIQLLADAFDLNLHTASTVAAKLTMNASNSPDVVSDAFQESSSGEKKVKIVELFSKLQKDFSKQQQKQDLLDEKRLLDEEKQLLQQQQQQQQQEGKLQQVQQQLEATSKAEERLLKQEELLLKQQKELQQKLLDVQQRLKKQRTPNVVPTTFDLPEGAYMRNDPASKKWWTEQKEKVCKPMTELMIVKESLKKYANLDVGDTVTKVQRYICYRNRPALGNFDKDITDSWQELVYNELPMAFTLKRRGPPDMSIEELETGKVMVSIPKGSNSTNDDKFKPGST